MKPLRYSLIVAALACGFASGQTTAYTTPVGYTTTTVYAAFGAGSPKNNVIAPDLQQPASWTGTVSSIAGDVVTIDGTVTAGAYNAPSFGYGIAYSYFMETADGYYAHVASNTESDITVEGGMGAQYTVGEQVTIRPHVTIADYFGAANEAGLLADPGGDAATADNIILIDEINGGTLTVMASDALGGTWITDAFEDAAGVPIYPDQGVQVLRRGLTPLSLVFAGEVDVNGRQIEVTSGVQIRPYVLPVATTLTDLGLYTGDAATGVVGSPSGDSGEADQITVLVDGIPSNYFYSEVDLTGDGPGWYDDSLNFVGATPLPSGAALIINRSNPVNSDPFVWVNPAPVISTL
ncbi:MAG: hypothetical protein K9N23_02065 [Akkermansiaceae bacterium]|nr:hypothetical protein [Akkermansiaceae bacterium]MCF7730436.1 hypothetical protein [Akkermansiaceae bacterium]